MINESLLQPDTPSALDICNAALSKIGEAPLDALIANESTASRLCVSSLPSGPQGNPLHGALDLRRHATTLDSVSAQAPNSLTPYQFTLPADCPARAGCGMLGMENAGTPHSCFLRPAAPKLHCRY